jgi:hypothetical protein
VLWSALMLELWAERFLGRPAAVVEPPESRAMRPTRIDPGPPASGQ